MEPKIILMEGFSVMGVMARVDPDQPGFFDEMWMKRFMPAEERIRKYATDQAYYGVFFHPQDPQAPVDYLAGMAVSGPEARAEAGDIVIRQVPSATYAVYECTFRDLGQASDFLLGRWLPASPYEYAHPLPDFEYYPPSCECSDSAVLIYIPVRKKSEHN